MLKFIERDCVFALYHETFVFRVPARVMHVMHVYYIHIYREDRVWRMPRLYTVVSRERILYPFFFPFFILFHFILF